MRRKHIRRFNDDIPKYISDFCLENEIYKFILNDDNSIDIEGDVKILDKKITKIPIKFRKVNGSFHCNNNYLTTLEGCPNEVGLDFICSGNKNLKSLEGCPVKVGRHFYGNNCNLTSLKGSSVKVGGDFYCNNNNLITLDGCPKWIGGSFCCTNNNLNTLKGAPKKVNTFYCGGNKLSSLKYSPICNTLEFAYNNIINFDNLRCNMFSCHGNPINEIWKLFGNINKIEYFNYMDIIRGDVVIIDRLNEFLEYVGKKPVVKVKGYKCI